jgi:hypothetical protein
MQNKCLWLASVICAALVHVPATAADNPLSRGIPQATEVPIEGRWNGANLERRSGCNAPQNNGSRGTYAEFDVSTDHAAGLLGITQTGVTGLVCNYYGTYHPVTRSASGSYTCTDGKRGTYQTKGILVLENTLSIRMDIVLDTTESCTIDAVIGGSRFFP